MSWTADVKPGQVLRITKMIEHYSHQMDITDEHPVWGIVLDDETMLVFSKIDQHGYPNAKGERWVSRVMPTEWADEDSRWAKAEEVPEDVPVEFWPIAARAALDEGV